MNIEKKYESEESVHALRKEVKQELEEAGRSTGYRNMSLINKTTAERINTLKSGDEFIVVKTAEAVNATQKELNSRWTQKAATNYYEKFKNKY